MASAEGRIKIGMKILMVTALTLTACGDSGSENTPETHEVPGSAEVPPTAAAEPEIIYASHILIPFQGCQQAPADAPSREEAESLLTAIADSIRTGDISFADAARRYSSCPSSQQGGFLGGFGRSQMVPEFENVAFNLQPGTVSDVFETGYGFHIVYREPTVRASHILIAYQGAERSTATRTQDEALQLVESIRDSIGNEELTFEDAAMAHSDCPSGREGGDLGPFSRNVMTPEFEDAAFALSVGDMSDVVETPFGYHLILRTE